MPQKSQPEYRFFFELCVMGFFAILSSTMSKNPVLNPFATRLGTPPELIGFIASASTIPGLLQGAALILSRPIMGRFSDQAGRRPPIVSRPINVLHWGFALSVYHEFRNLTCSINSLWHRLRDGNILNISLNL
jgi:MFS family permease